MKLHVTFLGVASSWGAAYRGPEQAPQAFWAAGLAESAARPHVTVDWHGILEPFDAPPKNDLPLHDVRRPLLEISHAVARELGEILAEQPLTMPIVLGGDHSVAFGTWSGVITSLGAFGRFGLLWIDAHMDSHTPKTASTGKWGGHWHGMPLAALLGHGDEEFITIGNKRAKLKPEHVALVGVRSFEQAEEELLRTLGVRIFTADDIARDGLKTVLQQALAIVSKAPQGWGISLDVDVFNPVDMPGVGTPEAGGVHTTEFLQAWSSLTLPSRPKAVEIVEYIPSKDPDGLGTAFVEKFIWLLLKK